MESPSPLDLDQVRAATIRSLVWIDGHADVASVFRDADLMQSLGSALAQPFASARVTAVAGLEAKGFAVGALVAAHLRCGLILVRKEGAHFPGSKTSERSRPDWRDKELLFRLRSDHLEPGDRVLVVDDWIETGAQAETVFSMANRLGADTVGVAALVDDLHEKDDVRRRLNVIGLVRAEELAPP